MTPKPYHCRHIFTDGHQCGSPALKGELLCFYHHGNRRPQTHQTVDGYTEFAFPEPMDLHAVQRGLAELLRLSCARKLDPRHAAFLLRALTAAGQNLVRIDRQTAALSKADPTRQPLADYVQDPALGTLAPAPAPPEPRPDGPLPDPAIPFTLPPVVVNRTTQQQKDQAERNYAKAIRTFTGSVLKRMAERDRLPLHLRDQRDDDLLVYDPELRDDIHAVLAVEMPQTPPPVHPRPQPKPASAPPPIPDFAETWPQQNQDFGLLQPPPHHARHHAPC